MTAEANRESGSSQIVGVMTTSRQPSIWFPPSANIQLQITSALRHKMSGIKSENGTDGPRQLA